MILISHRGNTTGENPAMENNPQYIQEALSKGFHVEVDVWDTLAGTFLGHDQPQYKINTSFLKNSRIWCHAKNERALTALCSIGAHVFWHQTDNYTITSRGWIWAYPDQPGHKYTIAVLPEIHKTDVKGFGGICSDYIADYK